MEEQNLEQAASLATTRHYCPIDGAIMYQGISPEGLPAWLCPECDYIEYIDAPLVG